jgi:4-amino-4-deoxy-L-arabinose transferase-like glycosyltransferase
LDPLTGIAFLFGFCYALARIFKALVEKILNRYQSGRFAVVYFFLFVWFFAMLAPEFLTAEGLPHSLRAIGTLPVVMIFSAVGLNYLWDYAESQKLRRRQWILGIIIASLAFVGIFNATKYHLFWAKKEKVAFSFNKNLTDIARFIKTLPQEKEKYIVTSFNTLERLPIFVLNSDLPNTRYLYPNELEKISPANQNNFTVILTERNLEAIQKIQARFPQLNLEEVVNPPGSVYFIFK